VLRRKTVRLPPEPENGAMAKNSKERQREYRDRQRHEQVQRRLDLWVSSQAYRALERLSGHFKIANARSSSGWFSSWMQTFQQARRSTTLVGRKLQLTMLPGNGARDLNHRAARPNSVRTVREVS
jgi:hypothetical protein